MSQKTKIRRHLRRGNSLTQLGALRRFGCMRLGARIWSLRRDGVPIKARMVEVGTGKRVAEYFIPRARAKR